MICAQCQHENDEGVQSCRICGIPLHDGGRAEQILCTECEVPNAPGNEFCSSCGSALSSGHATLEYRTPTGQEPPPLPRAGFTDIIDITFSIYTRHFLPFVLISAISQIPSVIAIFVLPTPEPPNPENPFANVDAIRIVALVISSVFNLIAGAAIIHGVCRHFLGRPILVSHSILYALHRSIRLLAAVVLFILGLVIPIALSIIIIGIPLLVFIIIVWIFFSHAVVVEQRGPVDALRRSWAIVMGSWWRVFGVVAGIVLTSIGALVISELIFTLGAEIAQPIGTFLAVSFSTLFSPVPIIALTVLYLDMRVRKDEYAHDDLAREMGEIRWMGIRNPSGNTRDVP